MTYDAFVSYSHLDSRLAAAVQAEVQRFAKPWFRRRAVRLFRDETTLVTAPELWPPIEQALEESTWFVLLASPDSARSRGSCESLTGGSSIATRPTSFPS